MYALTRTDLCYSHESTIHVDFPNLYNATLEGTQSLTMLLCDFFWRSNRNHYYLLLVFVMRALATSIPMYVRVVPTKIQYKQMHYYDPYHSTMFFFFTVNNEYQVFLFWDKIRRQYLEILSSHVYFINLLYIEIPRITGEYRSKYKFPALLACLSQQPWSICGLWVGGRA